MFETATLPWRLVWVTGASTGIGRELALQLAGRGVKVAVSARSAEKLAGLHSLIFPYPLDVTDSVAVQKTVSQIEHDLGAINLTIFSAAIYAEIEASYIDPQQFSRLMATNYMGVINCLSAVLPKMLARKAGHISWIASVAGYRGLPKAAAYGPTKAALINLAECIKPELALQGITISVINPGFVETPMTASNKFSMPFLMKPEDAARRTIEGLAKGKFEIAFPTRFVAILKLLRILPYRLYFWLVTTTTLKP